MGMSAARAKGRTRVTSSAPQNGQRSRGSSSAAMGAGVNISRASPRSSGRTDNVACPALEKADRSPVATTA